MQYRRAEWNKVSSKHIHMYTLTHMCIINIYMYILLTHSSPVVPPHRHRLKGTSTLHDSINSIDHDTADPQWSRLPGQSCAVPNKVETYLMTGSGGCSTLSFSRSGRYRQ